jgi:hypothetical protein
VTPLLSPTLLQDYFWSELHLLHHAASSTYPDFHISSMQTISSMHDHQDLFMLRASEMLLMVAVVMIQVFVMEMAAVMKFWDLAIRILPA